MTNQTNLQYGSMFIRIKSILCKKLGLLLFVSIFVVQLIQAQDFMEEIKILPRPLRNEAQKLIKDSKYQWIVHDMRISIFGRDDLKAIIDEDNRNFEINRTKEQLFLLQSSINKEKITIKYTKAGNTKAINWNPNTISDPRFRMMMFIILIIKNPDLDYELDSDPTTLLMIPHSSILKLNIAYEHCLIFNNTELKQDNIEQTCLVDSDGVITLPVFYESINSNVTPAIRKSDLDIWFDSQSNSYKMKLAGLSYHEAEKKITNFYYQRIGEDKQISEISVRIIPEKYFSTVEVHYKRRCYELRYSKSFFSEFFTDSKVRARIGLRKKLLRGIIFSRPNKLGTPQKREVRFHPKKDFKRKELLYPGDIIYLK